MEKAPVKQQEDLIYQRNHEAGYKKEEKRGGGGAKERISTSRTKDPAWESS